MIKGKNFERLIVATASHDACESIGGWSIGGCATFCKHAQLFGEDHLFGSQTGDWVMCDMRLSRVQTNAIPRHNHLVL
eukprot:scaffold22524_cov92-Amphora_coffeaeformis.AAC.1